MNFYKQNHVSIFLQQIQMKTWFQYPACVLSIADQRFTHHTWQTDAGHLLQPILGQNVSIKENFGFNLFLFAATFSEAYFLCCGKKQIM